MYRHPLDAVSLFFGLVLTAVGAVVVLDDTASHLLVGRWLWPTLFVAGGIVLLAGLIPSRTARQVPAEGGDDTGETRPLEW